MLPLNLNLSIREYFHGRDSIYGTIPAIKNDMV